MATKNDDHTALEIVEKGASFGSWQEENAVGYVADVDGRRGTVTFHQIHNAMVEIGDEPNPNQWG